MPKLKNSFPRITAATFAHQLPSLASFSSQSSTQATINSGTNTALAVTVAGVAAAAAGTFSSSALCEVCSL